MPQSATSVRRDLDQLTDRVDHLEQRIDVLDR
jgi:hypothetical protein